MPRKTFVGPDVPTLMAQAQSELGSEAVVIGVRRSATGAGFELTADDAVAAAVEYAFRPATRAPAVPVTSTPVTASPAPAAVREPRAWPLLGRRESHAGAYVLALVGPTGAGKTTTIAKLANHPEGFGGRRVGLLCLDSYRVGAVEQARIYADLSRLPFAAVYEPGDLDRALRRLRGCEVVLVDTAGRGPAAVTDLDETCAMLARIAPHELHVALPSGIREDLAMRVVAAWKARGATHVLPTKLDECPEDHTVFDVAMRHRLRVRWAANGQEVPADLLPASMPMMAAARRARAAEPAGVA